MIGLLIIIKKIFFTFFISSMILGLLDQLQIFWQLYLIELLELTQAVALGISKAFYRISS